MEKLGLYGRKKDAGVKGWRGLWTEVQGRGGEERGKGKGDGSGEADIPHPGRK